MWNTKAITSVLVCAAVALGDAAPSPVATSPSIATTSIKGHDPSDLPALYTPPPGPASQLFANLAGDVTIGITNMLIGKPAVSITATSDIGGLPPRAFQTGAFAETTQIVVPSGWAGAFTLDKVYDSFNGAGSRIEADWGINDPANLVYLDVSYSAGFTIPIVCTCGTDPLNTPVTGCNKALFSLRYCPVPCINNSPEKGPPDAFFAPCQGAAYTYPDDDGAVSACNDNNISCCLGIACPTVPRQPAGPLIKRETVAGGLAARRGLGREAPQA